MALALSGLEDIGGANIHLPCLFIRSLQPVVVILYGL
jgi:hypothetical protein